VVDPETTSLTAEARQAIEPAGLTNPLVYKG
jgi:hypothetical protein